MTREELLQQLRDFENQLQEAEAYFLSNDGRIDEDEQVQLQDIRNEIQRVRSLLESAPDGRHLVRRAIVDARSSQDLERLIDSMSQLLMDRVPNDVEPVELPNGSIAMVRSRDLNGLIDEARRALNEDSRTADLTTIEAEIEALRDLGALRRAANQVTAMQWNGNETREVTIGSVTHAIQGHDAQRLYRMLEERYQRVEAEMGLGPLPEHAGAQARVASGDPRYARSQFDREAVTPTPPIPRGRQESFPRDQVARGAAALGRAVVVASVEMYANAALMVAVGLVLLEIQISAREHFREWLNDTAAYLGTRLFHFCAGYAAAMRGQTAPAGPGMAEGREAALQRKGVLLRQYSQQDIESSAQAVHLFDVVFDAVAPAFLDRGMEVSREYLRTYMGGNPTADEQLAERHFQQAIERARQRGLSTDN